MKMKILATLVLGLVLTACSSNQPDWLNERSQQYPPERYLSAVGEADTRSTAEGRALANLAKIFAVASHEDEVAELIDADADAAWNMYSEAGAGLASEVINYYDKKDTDDS